MMTPIEQFFTLGTINLRLTAATIIDILIPHILQTNFGDSIVDSLRILHTDPLLQLPFPSSSMLFLHMLVISLLFLKLQSTSLAFNALTQMDDLYMPIKVMLIPETHAAMRASMTLDIRMGNHMSFKMRSPFEGFPAVSFLADVLPGLTVPLPHVPIEMGLLLEGLPTEFTRLAVQDQLLGELCESGLLKLFGVRHSYNIIMGR